MSSLRAREVVKQQALLRQAARAAREANAVREAAEFAATWLNRHRAAAAVGLSVHAFKRLQMRRQGPRPTKCGNSRQSRVIFSRAEIDRYLANPKAYNAQRAADKM